MIIYLDNFASTGRSMINHNSGLTWKWQPYDKSRKMIDQDYFV